MRGWAEGSGRDLLDVRPRASTDAGVAALVVTQIAGDGTLGPGPDLDGLAALLGRDRRSTSIASGGVGSLDDLARPRGARGRRPRARRRHRRQGPLRRRVHRGRRAGRHADGCLTCAPPGSSPASTSTPAGSSRASTSSACATPATRSSWPPATTPRAPTSSSSSTSPPSSDARDTMVDVVAAHRRAGLHPVHRRRRHPLGRRRPRACCGPGPTRCRSTPRPSTAPSWSPRSPTEFGAQCVVVAIDARRRDRRRRGLGGLHPRRPHADRARRRRLGGRGRCELGAGEILLTSMDRDGTRDGFDLELTRAVTDAVARAGDRQRRRRHARPPRRRRPRGRRRRGAGRVDLPLRRAHRRPRPRPPWPPRGITVRPA